MDAYLEQYNYPYIKLSGLEVLNTLEFDMLIIAVKKKKVSEEIRKQLADKGIENDKIFWSEPKLYSDME